MNRYTKLLAVVGMALVLAACQDPAPRLDFVGTSQVDGVERELSLTLERHEDRLTGEYFVAEARGTFNGIVLQSAVEAELTPSSTCTYSFAGTLSEATLTGSFEPTGCLGGQAGTWALELR